MQLQGFFYAAGGSSRRETVLEVEGDNYRLRAEDELLAEGEVQILDVSSRLGNIPRRIEIADAGVFETPDNDTVDRILKAMDHDDHAGAWLHQLESKWSLAALGVVLLLVLTVGGVIWGVPSLSKVIAFKLPPGVTAAASEQTLAALDEVMLEPSRLPESRKAELRERFAGLVRQLGETPFTYQLHFRDLPDGANAFALPSGDVVLTDGLDKLARDDREIDSILYHEIGHVELRHGLQQVISATILSAAAAYVAGDLSGSQELLTGLPLFLMQQNYSREAEAAADEFAFQKMIKTGIDPVCFASIMHRLTGGHEKHDDGLSQAQSERAMQYLASHPVTEDRIQRAIALAEEVGSERQCGVVGL